MTVTRDDRVELLAHCRVPGVSWHFVAREAQKPAGLETLLAARSAEDSREARDSLERLRGATLDLPAHREAVEEILDELSDSDVRLTTVLDDDYPANLRTIFNLPPFLFYRGELRAQDARSVAVVGTRQPTKEGLALAQRLAAELSEAGVTVVSGLARGIDTAAHSACLATGGRTVAVIGTGIRRVYPPENAELTERIVESGAVLSQFWPDGPPRTDTFPRRNVVMSGFAQGTVVVEASATSGAKMQARLALGHGRRVFLPAQLVAQHAWARRYLELSRRPGAVEIHEVEDIVKLLRSSESIIGRAAERRQLTLSLA